MLLFSFLFHIECCWSVIRALNLGFKFGCWVVICQNKQTLAKNKCYYSVCISWAKCQTGQTRQTLANSQQTKYFTRTTPEVFVRGQPGKHLLELNTCTVLSQRAPTIQLFTDDWSYDWLCFCTRLLIDSELVTTQTWFRLILMVLGDKMQILSW